MTRRFAVCDYLVALVRVTRDHSGQLLGARPRGLLGLFRATQAMVAIRGENFVSATQIQALLAHHVIIWKEGEDRNLKVGSVIEEILAGMGAPA